MLNSTWFVLSLWNNTYFSIIFKYRRNRFCPNRKDKVLFYCVFTADTKRLTMFLKLFAPPFLGVKQRSSVGRIGGGGSGYASLPFTSYDFFLYRLIIDEKFNAFMQVFYQNVPLFNWICSECDRRELNHQIISGIKQCVLRPERQILCEDLPNVPKWKHPTGAWCFLLPSDLRSH